MVCTPGRLLQHMDETPDFNCNSLQVLGDLLFLLIIIINTYVFWLLPLTRYYFLFTVVLSYINGSNLEWHLFLPMALIGAWCYWLSWLFVVFFSHKVMLSPWYHGCRTHCKAWLKIDQPYASILLILLSYCKN